MPHIEWEEGLSVGVDLIDRQHRTFLKMANELHDALLDGAPNELIAARDKALEELQDYVHEHFSAEIALMRESSYPEVERHGRLHDEFGARLRRYRREISDGSLVLTSEVMKAMINWFNSHIRQEDRSFGYFLSAKR